MLASACNKRGLSIVEVLITLVLTAVGIMALLSMQPVSWSAAGRSDFLGRASGILHSELERNEIWIMNPLNAVTVGTLPQRTVFASSQSEQQAGDMPFTVDTSISSFGTNAWTVTVRITWPGNNRGVADSVIVSRQESYRWL